MDKSHINNDENVEKILKGLVQDNLIDKVIYILYEVYIQRTTINNNKKFQNFIETLLKTVIQEESAKYNLSDKDSKKYIETITNTVLNNLNEFCSDNNNNSNYKNEIEKLKKILSNILLVYF